MRVLITTLCLFFVSNVYADNRFADLVGPIQVQPVKETNQVVVPTITWGGDVPFYVANGYKSDTQKDSIYSNLGLNVKLQNQDDFVQQVRDYVTGKSPFVRGTFRMLGQASEVLNMDPSIKPQVFLQISFSMGDHVVGRDTIRNLNDLKAFESKYKRKPKGVVQQGGPHVGLVDDMLKASQMTWDDVEIVWVNNLTDTAPAFRKDKTIDFCTVITPDMLGLTGGIDSVGTGAEGTVQDAKVFLSTAQFSRSIADVLAVRKDWYENHKDFVEKLTAGYFKACEDVVAMRRQFDETGNLDKKYELVLQTAQNIFGEAVIPSLEVDGHGLLLDCSFVGLPGNVAFFTDKGNLNGFDRKQSAALDLAINQGYAKTRAGFDPVVFDYKNLSKVAGIKFESPNSKPRIVAESISINPEDNLDDKTILSFTINFEPNQTEFSFDQYGSEFNRAIENASSFGNAVIVIRGHSDPTKTVLDLLKAGMSKGIITRTGQTGNWQYFINWGGRSKALDVEATTTLVELIKDGVFDGVPQNNPRETYQAALTLSYNRAEEVKEALSKYSKAKGVNLDLSQIQPVGAGIAEPVIAKPRSLEDAKKNMRVEFRIVKVPAEAIVPSDFDY